MNMNESIVVARFAKAVQLYEQMLTAANETERYKQELMMALQMTPEERDAFGLLLAKASKTKEETDASQSHAVQSS